MLAQLGQWLKGLRRVMDSEQKACCMIDELDSVDQWEASFERRSLGRTKIHRDAKLFFNEKSGVHRCKVRDVTNVGAGIAAQDLKIVPLDFLLSFDNFRTARMCRLIWRDGDLLGIAFKN
jgi:hypothetical protein